MKAPEEDFSMPAPSRHQIQEIAREQLARGSGALKHLTSRIARVRVHVPNVFAGTDEEKRLRRARWELRKANARHRLGVMRCRIDLRRATLTHRWTCRRAERVVAAAEKEASAEVDRADEYLRNVARPREIASYGPFALFDDSLKSPDWEVSLASVHAVILPAESAALKGVGSEALPSTNPPTRPRRSRLALEGRRGSSVHDFPRADRRARDFAHLVNVAALNAGKFDQQRREDMDTAAERLEETKAWATARLAQARRDLETTLANTTSLDEARHGLAKAQLDTAEIEASRSRVAALEMAVRTADLDLPPDPDDWPTE
jgi:hypothetical protein